jgi:hypothetical protein
VTTHYDVLGVTPAATSDQLKRAYYRRARTYHPDGHAGSSDALLGEAQRAMAELNAAWRVLRDPKERAAYDQTLPAERHRGRRPRRRSEERPPKLELGSGFRYWMASLGPVVHHETLRPRLSLVVDGARDLAPLRVLAPDRLYALHAGHSAVDDAQLLHLHGLSGLQFLDLTGTPVTDAGMIHLLGLEGLESLSLWRTAVGDGGMQIVGRLNGLRYLGLGETPITDAGLARLSGLTHLRVLQLWGTAVTGSGLRHLYGLGNLEMISLPRRVRGRHRRRLKAAVPGLTIV